MRSRRRCRAKARGGGAARRDRRRRHRDAPGRGACPGRQLQQALDRRQAPVFRLAPHGPRRNARAEDAGASTTRSRSRRRSSTIPRSYELSLDSKKMLVRKGSDYYVVDAGAKAPADLAKQTVPLARLDVPPRSARRVAPDVHRGVAARARLLLRPRHARPRLAGHPRPSTCRWSIA